VCSVRPQKSSILVRLYCAMAGRWNIFGDMAFNYPTLAEAYMVAALDGLKNTLSTLSQCGPHLRLREGIGRCLQWPLLLKRPTRRLGKNNRDGLKVLRSGSMR